MGPTSRVLTGGRLHFQHGPIDIVAYAQGNPAQVRAAHDDAWRRFSTVLDELVAEIAQLKSAVGAQCALRGDVARTMWDACHRCAEGFITPMAAVAGGTAIWTTTATSASPAGQYAINGDGLTSVSGNYTIGTVKQNALNATALTVR